jgi:signal transduction histidine kinase
MVVTDTGCGMSEQMLAQVFQPFEQEDGSTARKYAAAALDFLSSNI